VGSIQRFKAVRWGVATNIVWAWILTIPANNGNFYQINTSTGAATLLGSTGLQMQVILVGDGNLYGFSNYDMYSINLTNGALTFVRSTPAALGIFYDGTDVLATSTTPEPGTLVMLGSGALAAAGVSRRKFKA
jgi:hypothetical protein